MSGEFRCAFFARDYDGVVAFYREGLEFAEIESWNRGRDDRGTLFAAGRGVVEVLALPRQAPDDSVWDQRPPRGVTLVVEVDDVAARHRRAVEAGLEIAEPLTDQPWGHRSFVVRDPQGLALYFFSHSRASSGPSS